MIGNAEVSKTSQSGSKPDRGAKFVEDKIDFDVYMQTKKSIELRYNRPRVKWEMDDNVNLIEDELEEEIGEK